MRVFDCHSHWGTKRGYIFRTQAELDRQEKIWKTKVHYYSEQEMLDYMRSHHVRTILDLSIVKFMPIEQIRDLHDYAFDLQRKNRDVIFGQWLQFDPRRGDEAIREFERCIAKKAGFAAFCVNGQVTGVPATDPLWDPFYQLSQSMGLPVMILTGLTGIGQGQPGGMGYVLDDGHPRHIDRVAARYPDLKVLAARPAYPWQDEMIAVMLHKSNVTYELHGWGPRQYAPALKKEIGRRLQSRILFGCDFPVLKYEKVIADWQSEGYSQDVLEKVLWENAEAYFQAWA